MAARQQGRQNHYYGVTMLNLALISIHQDRPHEALTQLEDAAQAFEPSSAWIETAAALVLKAATLAQLGMVDEASSLSNITLRRPELRAEPDLLLETAEYEDAYGDPTRAQSLLDEADSSGRLTAKHRSIRALIGARYIFGEDASMRPVTSRILHAGWGNKPGVWRREIGCLSASRGCDRIRRRRLGCTPRESAAQNLRAHRWRRDRRYCARTFQTPEELSAVVDSSEASIRGT